MLDLLALEPLVEAVGLRERVAVEVRIGAIRPVEVLREVAQLEVDPHVRPDVDGRDVDQLFNYDRWVPARSYTSARSGRGWPIVPTSAMSRRKGRPTVQSTTARTLRAVPGI